MAVSLQYSFDMGADCAVNGANTTNCDFRLFSSKEHTAAWESGKKSVALRFSGSDYVPRFDFARLTGQILRVYEAMKDGEWRTLDEIHRITGDPHASISAQLRNLRKVSFGSHKVEKCSRGDRESGLFEYRLQVRP